MSERTLKITSPLMKGDDAELAQQTFNSQMKSWNVDYRIDADGVWDVDSRDAWKTMLYGMGIAQSEMDHGLTPELRVKVRNRELTSEEKKRFDDRVDWRRRLRKRYAKAVTNPTSSSGTFTGSPIPGVRPVASTHQTAGLAGFPAVDYFAKAGTATVSPVNGVVSRLSGHNPAGGPTGGVHGPFGWSVYIEGDNGKTYYLTHMGTRTVKVGQRVKQGEKIGTVGNYARWGGVDHIHQGIHG